MWIHILPGFFFQFWIATILESLNKSCKRSNAGCKYQALRIDLPAIIMPSSSFFPNKLRGSAHGASWLHPAEIFKPVTQEVAAFSQLLPLGWNSHCYYKRLLYKRSVCVTDTEPFTASSPNGRRKNNIYPRERGMTFCRFYIFSEIIGSSFRIVLMKPWYDIMVWFFPKQDVEMPSGSGHRKFWSFSASCVLALLLLAGLNTANVFISFKTNINEL